LTPPATAGLDGWPPNGVEGGGRRFAVNFRFAGNRTRLTVRLACEGPPRLRSRAVSSRAGAGFGRAQDGALPGRERGLLPRPRSLRPSTGLSILRLAHDIAGSGHAQGNASSGTGSGRARTLFLAGRGECAVVDLARFERGRGRGAPRARILVRSGAWRSEQTGRVRVGAVLPRAD